MAFYKWTDQLATGDEVIDRQHRVLISYINELAEVMEQKNDFGILTVSLLGKLATYTKTHFLYEEMLFHIHHYPDAENHHQYHQALADQVDTFYARFKAGDEHLEAELLDFLMDWLNRHILGSDLDYVNFINPQKK